MSQRKMGWEGEQRRKKEKGKGPEVGNDVREMCQS